MAIGQTDGRQRIDPVAPLPASGDAGVSRRIAAVDIARFFGIALVYYGHVVEQAMYLGNPAARDQYKFIYSFHMPLFFVLSGMIAKDWGEVFGPAAFLRSRLASRVAPMLVFNLLLGLASLAWKPDFPPIPLQTAADYGHAVVMALTRLPVFDIPTWFLMCLVSVEIIHAVVFRFLRGSDLRIAGAALVFLLAGYALNLRWDFFADGTNWWLWNEAVTMYAFYLVGVSIARRRLLDIRFSRAAAGIAALVALALVAATYDLNAGPFRMKIPAVVILAAAHGELVWFTVTALVGTAAVLAAALWASPSRWLAFLGRNALTLFCLNGLFYGYVNPRAAHWFVAAWPPSGWSLFVYATGLTALSLAVAVPLVIALDRTVPQLVGRPTAVGPWLPAILHVAPPARGSSAMGGPTRGGTPDRPPESVPQ